MKMGMFAVMRVLVLVHIGNTVYVDMPVRPVQNGPPDAPYAVGETEGNKKPCGNRSARRLYELKALERHPQGNPDETEHDGTQYMAEAARKGHGRGLDRGPFPRPGEHHKGYIVIGAKERVKEPDGYGGDQ